MSTVMVSVVPIHLTAGPPTNLDSVSNANQASQSSITNAASKLHSARITVKTRKDDRFAHYVTSGTT